VRVVSVIGIALLMSSCGMTEGRYNRSYSEVFCEKVFECWPQDVVENAGYGANVAECQVTTATSLESVERTCEHNPTNAQLCVDGLSLLDCDDFTSARLPESCDEVCN